MIEKLGCGVEAEHKELLIIAVTRPGLDLPLPMGYARRLIGFPR
jgi:hypothetical protein